MRNLIILLIFLFVNNTIWSNWEKIESPTGASISQIKQLNEKVYSLALNSGIYSFDNNSKIWDKVDKTNDLLRLATTFEIDTTSKTFYVAVNRSGIYKSINLSNWQLLHNGRNSKNEDMNVSKIKTFLNYVIFISSNEIYLSDDYGINWRSIKGNLSNLTFYDFIFFDSKIYLATNQGLLISENYGETWSSVVFQGIIVYGVYIAGDRVLATVINPSLNPIVSNIYEKESFSDDFKLYFENTFKDLQVLNISSKGNKIFIHTLEFDNTEFVYKYFQSNNNGNSWERLKTHEKKKFEYFSTASCLYENEILIGTLYDGVHSFNFSNNQESKIDEGLDAILTNTYFETNNVKFATSLNSGVYFKHMDSINWSRSQSSPLESNSKFKRISNAIKIQDRYFVATNLGLYSSLDGINWTNYALSEYDLLDIKHDNDNIYVLGNFSFGYVFVSTDKGNSWASKRLINDAYGLSLFVESNKFYVGSSIGLLVSNDLGNNWELVNSDFTNTKIIRNIIKQKNNSILISTNKEIYRSEDDGKSWILVYDAINNFVNALFNYDNLVIASTSIGTLYSYDYGSTWNLNNEGLESPNIRRISNVDTTLFAFQASGGIYKGNINNSAPIKIISHLDKIICKGSSLSISYQVNPNMTFKADNKFYVQVSDEHGVFSDNSQIIGEIYSTSNGIVNVLIPETINNGNKYRLRLISSSPVFVGIDNLYDLIITDKPQPIISGEVNVCNNIEYSYSIGKADGFEIRWTITNGQIIGKINEENVQVKWTNEGSASLKVTLTGVSSCNGEGLINVEVHNSPKKPIISFDGTNLISNEENGNQWYHNGNLIPGATEKVYQPELDGNYTVVVKSEFNCDSEFSDPYFFQNISDKLILKVDTLNAYTNDDVWLNIRLIKNKKFYELNISRISFDLIFNASLLYPKNNDKGVVINGKRFLKIETDTNLINGNILSAIPMKVMLGNSDKTEISIENLKIDDKNFGEFTVTKGMLYLLDVCYDGGPRLITSEPFLQIDKIIPNPIQSNFKLSIYSSDDQETRIYLSDIFGNKIEKLYDNKLTKGLHELNLKISNFAIGDYFIVAESDYGSTINKLIISR